jgi:hypothetical protein
VREMCGIISITTMFPIINSMIKVIPALAVPPVHGRFNLEKTTVPVAGGGRSPAIKNAVSIPSEV